MTQLDALWGGILDAVSLDIGRQVAFIDVRVVQEGREAVHHLEVRGADQFRFSSTIPGPWTYAELTEIGIDRLAEGRFRVSMMIWSEQAGIVIEGTAVVLDGAELVNSDVDS